MSLPTHTPTHLPNEIWLQILQHTTTTTTPNHEEDATTSSSQTAQALWQSLRPTSSQLKLCVEEHFHKVLLQQFRVFLPITLPSYDQRNPLKGFAVFLPEDEVQGVREKVREDSFWIKFQRTEPEHYRTQFLTRWEGMRDAGTGFVKDVVWWEVEFGGRRVRVKFRDARVEGDGEEVRVGVGEWRGMLTAFFKA